MPITSSFKAGVDDIANGICLRSDVHRFLDNHGFLIYPANASSFMAYVIDRDEADYASLLHWRLLKVPDRVFAELLYARFVYAVINLPRSKPVLPVAVEEEHCSEPVELDDESDADGENVYPLNENNLETTFFRIFPQLREEREYSTDPYYNKLMIHPETPRMQRLMEEYKRKNPQVGQRSQNTAESSGTEYGNGDDADEAAWEDFVGEDDAAE
ncbi:hypothetical protein L226DRAFT_611910 [Lentinus tigrinus ALCF2SS1-7]|uniref:HNH nuclease domain-containing protein n=1 Tax=Lentinus tigrinus ALCF2SS1-6 TaxID=1328759 RepID=A0A5C2SMH8_9APHY|nr:hypothetical protein L227DRAFT_608031 [Lentinus tigrinus ALCF2SS1-6]RPD76567.1 hypothetical protein L226DRAFT_611910 [Lentinus tigrinus ALCF2SS1-7]